MNSDIWKTPKIESVPYDYWKTRTCGTCEYFVDLPTSVKTGIVNKVVVKQCRRHPPLIIVTPVKTPAGTGMAPNTVYPQLPESYPACGDYQQKMQ